MRPSIRSQCGRTVRTALLLLIGMLPLETSAQNNQAKDAVNPTAATTPVLSIADVEAMKNGLEAATDLDDATKTAALDAYRQALEQLQTAKKQGQQAADYRKRQDDAKSLAAGLKQELSRPEPPLAVDIAPDESVVQLEQRLAAAQSSLSDARKELARLEAEPNRRAQRRVEVPKLIEDAKQKLADVQKALAANAPPGEAPQVTQATRILLLGRQRALEETLDALEQELATYDMTIELLPLQRDAALRRVNEAEKRVKALQAAVEARRAGEAERQAQAARRAATSAHPALKELAAENTALAERRTGPEGLAAKISAAEAAAEAIDKKLVQVTSKRESIEEKLKIPGIESILGPQLLTERRELPDVRRLSRNIRQRDAERSHVRLEWQNLRDARRALPSIDAQLESILSDFKPAPGGATQEQVATQARQLLEAKRQLLDDLLNDYETYSNGLTELSTKEQSLIAETEKSATLFDRHILWVKSSAPIDRQVMVDAWSAARWLAGPAQWEPVIGTFGGPFVNRAFLSVAAIVLIVFLFLLERPLCARLAECGERARASLAEPFSITARALFLTLILAAVAPGIVGLVGWYLAEHFDDNEFARAVGGGLLVTAANFLSLELVRQVVRSNGLAEAHFRWRNARIRRIRRNLRWLILVGLPAIFLVGVFERQATDAYRDSLGRLALIFGLGALSVFLWRVLAPAVVHRGEESSIAVQKHRAPLWKNAAYLGFVAAPVALAMLAAFGYYYTSLVFSWHLLATGWLFLCITVLNAMAVRWLYLARGKLALEQVRKQREQAGEETADAAPTPTDEGPIAVEEKTPVADLAAINAQTRRLLRIGVAFASVVGVWLIWADVLPALTFLERELWSTTAGATGEPVIITYADVILALIVAVVAYIAARNIPGLLEVAVLQSLPLDSGARYAITALARYAIYVLGVVIAFGLLGIDWSKVQWLVAAFGLGIAFGLQEIFANFVSGMILLAERPIRVGDIVTIGDVTGIVTRIRIRATTVRDWDRKELIVPNKELITGRLLNWTLTDQVNRVVIPVGIAYGSDTERARELLFKILREHPLVVDDPAPLVTFEGFGDSALNFVVRAYLPDLQNRLETMHQLHTTIHRVFAEAGIEISFPQRDVHVHFADGVPPSVAAMQGAAEPAAAGPGNGKNKDGSTATDAARAQQRRGKAKD